MGEPKLDLSHAGELDERSQMSLRVITTPAWLYGMILVINKREHTNYLVRLGAEVCLGVIDFLAAIVSDSVHLRPTCP